MMIAKYIGAAMIFSVCAGVGIWMSASHKRQERTLAALCAGICYMENDLRYRLTPLPQLLEQTAQYCGGTIGEYFHSLAAELDKQICTDVFSCTCAALAHTSKLPDSVCGCLLELGRSLGKLDAQGQLDALSAVNCNAQQLLQEHCKNKEAHRRSYRTLGFCAGVGLVILFL